MSGKIVILFLFLTAGITAFVAYSLSGLEHKTYTSPDLRFKVVVDRTRFYSWLPLMLKASDLPGKVSLYDMKTGKRLGQKPLEAVLLVQEVVWTSTNARIPFVVTWQLPPPKEDRGK